MITNRLTKSNCTKLLTGRLTQKEAYRLLAFIRFEDWQSAYQTLQKMAKTPQMQEAMIGYLPHLLVALSNAADPDRVLSNIIRFADSVPDERDLSRYLAQKPRAIEILVTLFAGSQFLTDILLRHPEYLGRLTEHQALAKAQPPANFSAKALAAAETCSSFNEQLDALRQFQRWQLLRIGTSDLLGLLDMSTITAQLSHLADSLIQTCLKIAAQATGISAEGFVVLGMGKLGGQELNYSSDIDLLFLGQSSGDAYLRLAKQLIDALTRPTAEGFLYRVDMRLRPWGSVGALVTSVDGHLAYLNHHARLWEKQALLKARIVAGDEAVGTRFLHQVEPLVFAFDPETVQTDVREMKKKIEDNLRRRGRKWGEIKLGEGSIRDIEFLVQYLQLAHGDTKPQVRSRNTLDALSLLAANRLISYDEHRILSNGYKFLRSVEHWLQMMHYRQMHTLPTDPKEQTNLARRLGFQFSEPGEGFLAQFEQHTIAIRLIYESYLGAETPDSLPKPTLSPANIERHLARLSPGYATTFSENDIDRHADLAERLSENNLVEVAAIPLQDNRWQVTIIGYDYLGMLSIICGLFFAHGLDIHQGNVFTYSAQTEPAKYYPTPKKPWQQNKRRKNGQPTPHRKSKSKIVDVFIVSPLNASITPDTWTRYAADLAGLLAYLDAGKKNEAQGKLVKQLASLYQKINQAPQQLYPVDIEIDNDTSEHTTILRIEALDTIGFLYEFTNALALAGIQIDRVAIGAAGNHVYDVLYVTDSQGKKITTPAKLRELRAATVLTKHFTHLLPYSPNPEAALLHFSQFLQQLFARPDWPDELVSLEKPEVLDALARLLGISSFLWTDFFRMQYENLFPVVRNTDDLAHQKSKAQLGAELTRALQPETDWEGREKTLNEFKDREMFRIDMRHILGHTVRFGQFSTELTELAEVVVNAAYQLSRAELESRFGRPHLADGTPCPVSICALGKCGGRELGFASDIELILIYADTGKTDGPKRISNAHFFEEMVRKILGIIQAKREGIFELDLRLRPYGTAGSLAVALDSFSHYYAADGPAWAYERQALVKLRHITGDTKFGERVAALRDKIVYSGTPFDAAAMRGMRERQVRHLVTPGTINAKHSPGGLVDIEYLVQGLQITYGADIPALRQTNTREAMTALAEANILSTGAYMQLRQAHIFIRRVINALRMVHGNAKDLTIPPPESEDYAFLARRLNYEADPNKFNHDLTHHTRVVQDINSQLLGT